MISGVALLLVALAFSAVAAAPSPLYENSEEVVIPQKRTALVLDRLDPIASQKALHEPPAEPIDGLHTSARRMLPESILLDAWHKSDQRQNSTALGKP